MKEISYNIRMLDIKENLSLISLIKKSKLRRYNILAQKIAKPKITEIAKTHRTYYKTYSKDAYNTYTPST